MRKQTKRRVEILFITWIAILSVAACGNKSKKQTSASTATTSEITGTQSVDEYKGNTDTNYIVNLDGKKKNISKDVTNYSNGSLYLSPDGIEEVFGADITKVSDESKADFDKRLTGNGMVVDDGEYVKFTSPGHSFIVKEGSKLYVFDDVTKYFNDSVIRTQDKRLSIPLTELIFSYGYPSIGMSIDGNTVNMKVSKQEEAPSKFSGAMLESTAAETSPASESAETTTEAATANIIDMMGTQAIETEGTAETGDTQPETAEAVQETQAAEQTLDTQAADTQAAVQPSETVQ